VQKSVPFRTGDRKRPVPSKTLKGSTVGTSLPTSALRGAARSFGRAGPGQDLKRPDKRWGGETIFPVPRSNGRGGSFFPPGSDATRLILTVVICLSLRLSHASPSTRPCTTETANGSLNQLQSTRRRSYTDNRSNSRANTCKRPGAARRRAYLPEHEPTQVRGDPA
jgi:hypothetical protein